MAVVDRAAKILREGRSEHPDIQRLVERVIFQVWKEELMALSGVVRCNQFC